MAKLQMIKEDKWKIIATAAANQTYLQQLNTIAAAYFKLNISQRENSILNVSGNQMRTLSASANAGRFTSASITGASQLVVWDANLGNPNASPAVSPTIKKVTLKVDNTAVSGHSLASWQLDDMSSETNTGGMSLSIFE